MTSEDDSFKKSWLTGNVLGICCQTPSLVESSGLRVIRHKKCSIRGVISMGFWIFTTGTLWTLKGGEAYIPITSSRSPGKTHLCKIHGLKRPTVWVCFKDSWPSSPMFREFVMYCFKKRRETGVNDRGYFLCPNDLRKQSLK